MGATRGWMMLAGGFPPTLVTNAPSTDLKPAQTPAATGIDATAEGYLKTGTMPAAVTKVTKTYTVGGVVYTWYYDRMWKISGATLIYGAPDYTDLYLAQEEGLIDFNEDTKDVLAFLPIGTDGLAVFKESGAYIIQNASDRQGRFRVGDFMQEAKIGTATHAAEMDGTVYFCSGTNVYAMTANGQTQEISFPVRGQITAAAVTTDPLGKYVIIGSTHAYDVNTKRWFQYSGSTFAYTSPALKQRSGEPFAVDKIGFSFDKTATNPVELKFQTRCESRDWELEQTVTIETGRGGDEFIAVTGPAQNTRSFQVRVTALASTVKLKTIMILASKFEMDNQDT